MDPQHERDETGNDAEEGTSYGRSGIFHKIVGDSDDDSHTDLLQHMNNRNIPLDEENERHSDQQYQNRSGGNDDDNSDDDNRREKNEGKKQKKDDESPRAMVTSVVGSWTNEEIWNLGDPKGFQKPDSCDYGDKEKDRDRDMKGNRDKKKNDIDKETIIVRMIERPSIEKYAHDSPGLSEEEIFAKNFISILLERVKIMMENTNHEPYSSAVEIVNSVIENISNDPSVSNTLTISKEHKEFRYQSKLDLTDRTGMDNPMDRLHDKADEEDIFYWRSLTELESEQTKREEIYPKIDSGAGSSKVDLQPRAILRGEGLQEEAGISNHILARIDLISTLLGDLKCMLTNTTIDPSVYEKLTLSVKGEKPRQGSKIGLTETDAGWYHPLQSTVVGPDENHCLKCQSAAALESEQTDTEDKYIHYDIEADQFQVILLPERYPSSKDRSGDTASIMPDEIFAESYIAAILENIKILGNTSGGPSAPKEPISIIKQEESKQRSKTDLSDIEEGRAIPLQFTATVPNEDDYFRGQSSVVREREEAEIETEHPSHNTGIDSFQYALQPHMHLSSQHRSAEASSVSPMLESAWTILDSEKAGNKDKRPLDETEFHSFQHTLQPQRYQSSKGRPPDVPSSMPDEILATGYILALLLNVQMEIASGDPSVSQEPTFIMKQQESKTQSKTDLSHADADRDGLLDTSAVVPHEDDNINWQSSKVHESEKTENEDQHLHYDVEINRLQDTLWPQRSETNKDRLEDIFPVVPSSGSTRTVLENEQVKTENKFPHYDIRMDSFQNALQLQRNPSNKNQREETAPSAMPDEIFAKGYISALLEIVRTKHEHESRETEAVQPQYLTEIDSFQHIFQPQNYSSSTSRLVDASSAIAMLENEWTRLDSDQAEIEDTHPPGGIEIDGLKPNLQPQRYPNSKALLTDASFATPMLESVWPRPDSEQAETEDKHPFETDATQHQHLIEIDNFQHTLLPQRYSSSKGRPADVSSVIPMLESEWTKLVTEQTENEKKHSPDKTGTGSLQQSQRYLSGEGRPKDFAPSAMPDEIFAKGYISALLQNVKLMLENERAETEVIQPYYPADADSFQHIIQPYRFVSNKSQLADTTSASPDEIFTRYYISALLENVKLQMAKGEVESEVKHSETDIFAEKLISTSPEDVKLIQDGAPSGNDEQSKIKQDVRDLIGMKKEKMKEKRMAERGEGTTGSMVENGLRETEDVDNDDKSRMVSDDSTKKEEKEEKKKKEKKKERKEKKKKEDRGSREITRERINSFESIWLKEKEQFDDIPLIPVRHDEPKSSSVLKTSVKKKETKSQIKDKVKKKIYVKKYAKKHSASNKESKDGPALVKGDEKEKREKSDIASDAYSPGEEDDNKPPSEKKQIYRKGSDKKLSAALADKIESHRDDKNLRRKRPHQTKQPLNGINSLEAGLTLTHEDFSEISSELKYNKKNLDERDMSDYTLKIVDSDQFLEFDDFVYLPEIISETNGNSSAKHTQSDSENDFSAHIGEEDVSTSTDALHSQKSRASSRRPSSRHSTRFDTSDSDTQQYGRHMSVKYSNFGEALNDEPSTDLPHTHVPSPEGSIGDWIVHGHEYNSYASRVIFHIFGVLIKIYGLVTFLLDLKKTMMEHGYLTEPPFNPRQANGM